ncbi:MAG: membrane protein insertase YidC [Halomonadaceae bacterium]|nr:MAG: membrane protein insertase YidC [Halomonadaceae bacterium]
MDIQRIAIWLGLAIVSYLMILAWNEDYHQRPDAPVQVEEQQRERSDAPADEFTVPDEDPESDGPREFAVPDEDTGEDRAPSGETPDADGDTITVRTDVLDMEISLKGGHITRADLLEYDRTLGSEEPLRLLSNDSNRVYILESSLIGRDGPDAARNAPAPTYQVSQNTFELADGQDSLSIDLRYETDAGVPITKRYTFDRGSYHARVTYHIENTTNETWQGNFSGKIVRDESGDPTGQSTMGIRAYLGMVINTPESAYSKYDFGDLNSSPIALTAQGGWIAFIQHYFMTSWIPDPEQRHNYQTMKRNGLHVIGFVSPATRIEPGQSQEVGSEFYLGPKIIENLKDIAPSLDRTVDFGWLFFISLPLFYILDWFHGLVGNWGVAIILLTLLVKTVFFKLSATSYRSMANMRRVAPQLQRLRDLYGEDKQKMSQEMMALYKKEKINPLGGCLPILVQMPVFIALYWVLFESVQLRHAPFFGWITDLSVMDPYFILPILMGASMFLQMQLNPTPPDPIQAKVMKMMPIIFTVFFLWFPAGLVLYWLSNNVLSIAQQYYITKQIEKTGGKTAKG